MKWEFSDGTAAYLGGAIQGGTIFAQELRLALKEEPLVPDGPMPCNGIPLDVRDASGFDWFLRNEMDRPCNKRRGIELVKAPRVEPLVVQDFEEVDGAVY